MPWSKKKKLFLRKAKCYFFLDILLKPLSERPKIKTRVDSSAIQLLMYTVVTLQHFTAIFSIAWLFAVRRLCCRVSFSRSTSQTVYNGPCNGICVKKKVTMVYLSSRVTHTSYDEIYQCVRSLLFTLETHRTLTYKLDHMQKYFKLVIVNSKAVLSFACPSISLYKQGKWRYTQKNSIAYVYVCEWCIKRISKKQLHIRSHNTR